MRINDVLSDVGGLDWPLLEKLEAEQVDLLQFFHLDFYLN